MADERKKLTLQDDVCVHLYIVKSLIIYQLPPCYTGNGSDVFGSDICTCEPYLTYAIEESIRGAQNGGVGVVVYFSSAFEPLIIAASERLVAIEFLRM